MGFGSLAYTKDEYAKTTAATIAYFLSLQRDAVGLVTFDERIGEYVPARFRTGHLHRLMMCLEHTLTGTATRLEPPIEQIASTVTKRGLIVLISDLLAPIDTLETQLGYLRSRGHEVVLLRILDPAEVNFQFDSPSPASTSRSIGGGPSADNQGQPPPAPTAIEVLDRTP